MLVDDSSVRVEAAEGAPPRSIAPTWPIAEVLVLLVAVPLLTFPNRWSWFALALLPLVWLARLVWHRDLVPSVGSDWPLVGLLVMTSVSLIPSVDLQLSLPK